LAITQSKLNNYNNILQLGIRNQLVGLNQQLGIRLIKSHMHTSNLVCHNQLGITLIQIRLSPISLTAQLGLTHTESHSDSSHTITQFAHNHNCKPTCPIHFTSINTTKLTNKSHKTASPSRATPSPGSAPTWHNFLP
jgi:hypothetical protein